MLYDYQNSFLCVKKEYISKYEIRSRKTKNKKMDIEIKDLKLESEKHNHEKFLTSLKIDKEY